MLLTLTCTRAPASDLGYLLHKHPDRVQRFDLPVGQAYVFYPEVGPERCTAALLLEVDPIGLVRGRRAGGSDAFSLGQYVNDRPYAASSMVAVALGRVFRTAMAGRCDARPELPGQPLPLEIAIPALPCRGGTALAERLFGPLGWTVRATALPLDPQVPAWGTSRYVDLRLTGTLRLADALNHLYVLLPVLDDAKHYWVSADEVDKLLRAGAGWLAGHPQRDMITGRYLAHQREFVLSAVGRLAESDDTEPDVLDNAVAGSASDGSASDGSASAWEVPQQPVALAARRRDAVLTALRSAGAARVVDLGCGEGALLRAMMADPAFTEIVGVDVSPRALEHAVRRLRMERLSDSQRNRVRLVQSSLTYRDQRLAGYDAAVLMEVIEHIDEPRLPALARAVFGAARPGTVLVTTPNVEYNVRYDGLPADSMRHRDHRFEWTRSQFQAWAGDVATEYGYRVSHVPVGDEDPDVGPPTQMAIFTRTGR